VEPAGQPALARDEVVSGHRSRLERCRDRLAELTPQVDAERELRNAAVVDAYEDRVPVADIARWAGFKSEGSVIRVVAEAG